MPKCRSCGADSPPGSRFCKVCGKGLPVETGQAKPAMPVEPRQQGLRCKMCNAVLPDQFTFCVSCGDPMCLSCARNSNVVKRYAYTQTYIVVDRTVTFIISFPRCANCKQMEEQLTWAIREKLRPTHALMWKSIDVTKAKYAEQDPDIARLQQQLLSCSCPEQMLACPRCGAKSAAHQYDKLLHQIKKGKARPRNSMIGPFGEGGRPLIDAISCRKCGYEGVFVSGWGLRRFLQRNGPRPLEKTMWVGASREMLAGTRV